MGTRTQYHYKDPDNRDFESSDFLPYGTLNFSIEINSSRKPDDTTQVDDEIFEVKKNTTKHFKMKNKNIKPGLDSDNIGSNAAMQLKIFYQSQILCLLNYLFLVAHTFVNF